MRDTIEARRKLTKRVVDDIQLTKTGQRFINDADLPGFKLRVTMNSKTYIVERRVNGTNRRITIGKHGALTPELARREAIKLLADMAVGEDPTIKKAKQRVSSLTLGEVLEAYIANRRLRPQTIESVRGLMHRCLPDWLDKPLIGITPQMVEERHKALPHETVFGTSGQVQANMVMRTLNALINYAIDNTDPPLVMVNPVRRLHKNRAWYDEPHQPNVIPDRKLASWYKAIISLDQTVYRDFYLFLLLTGLRRFEAGSLRWEDVDFEDKSITIPAEVTKNGEFHTLPLSDFLVQLLTFRRMLTGNSPLVFPRDDDPNQHISFSCRVLQHASHRAGYKFSHHVLRYSFLSMAAKLALPHQFVKKPANHIGNADHTDAYIFLHPENLRESMQAITDRFVGLMGAKIEDLEPDIAPKIKVAAVTLREVLNAYLKAKPLRANTVRHYKTAIAYCLADWLDFPVSEITEDIVIAQHRQLGKRSPHQANSSMSALSSLLNFAAANYINSAGAKLIASNPVSCMHVNQAWYATEDRTSFIPPEKLKAWYRALSGEA